MFFEDPPAGIIAMPVAFAAIVFDNYLMVDYLLSWYVSGVALGLMFGSFGALKTYEQTVLKERTRKN